MSASSSSCASRRRLRLSATTAATNTAARAVPTPAATAAGSTADLGPPAAPPSARSATGAPGAAGPAVPEESYGGDKLGFSHAVRQQLTTFTEGSRRKSETHHLTTANGAAMQHTSGLADCLCARTNTMRLLVLALTGAASTTWHEVVASAAALPLARNSSEPPDPAPPLQPGRRASCPAEDSGTRYSART